MEDGAIVKPGPAESCADACCREPPAPRAPTSDGSHVGDPGFIDEDEEDETGQDQSSSDIFSNARGGAPSGRSCSAGRTLF